MPSVTIAQAANTRFLNVDLEIYSRHDLDPLVNRFGSRVLVLFLGKTRGKYSARLEIARQFKTPDSAMRAFCRLANDLPESERNIWDSAAVRSFSIGVEAEVGSPVRDFQVRQDTVKSVSEIGAEIVLTVYAPAPRRSRKSG
jgi:hypothetical protein